jgi:hypothetical protein
LLSIVDVLVLGERLRAFFRDLIFNVVKAGSKDLLEGRLCLDLFGAGIADASKSALLLGQETLKPHDDLFVSLHSRVYSVARHSSCLCTRGPDEVEPSVGCSRRTGEVVQRHGCSFWPTSLIELLMVYGPTKRPVPARVTCGLLLRRKPRSTLRCRVSERGFRSTQVQVWNACLSMLLIRLVVRRELFLQHLELRVA